MANTDISVTNDKGVLVPSASSVALHEGDTVSFSMADGSDGVLFFSPDSTGILSPPPAGPVPFGGHHKASFTFTSAEPGAYSVYFKKAATDSHPEFPVAESKTLVLKIDAGDIRFGGPNNSPVGTRSAG